MFRPSPRRTIFLLLALVLVGPWPAAAAGETSAAWRQPWDLVAQLWNAFAGLWADSGCTVDPSGACGAGSQAENGCTVDPDGRCAGSQAFSTADEGCSIDPSGGCKN